MDSDQDNIFEIVAGTYEEFLLCYRFARENREYKLRQTVASHSHKASLRAVATCKSLLASGGADEAVHIYNLIERREHGLLSHHSGTITCLEFSRDGAYLMTGSEDGAISLVKTGSWKVAHMWTNAHKGAGVTWFNIHPSGKVALSVGKDHMVRTWNLITGRRAFTVSLKKRCGALELVQWSLEGKWFAIPYNRKIDIYEASKTIVSCTLELSSKVICLTFIQDNILVVGGNDGHLSCHDCITGAELWKIKIELEEEETSRRIKAINFNAPHYLIAATSQGGILVFETAKEKPPKLLASVMTNCRITCLAISDPFRGKELKNSKKRVQEADNLKANDNTETAEVKKRKLEVKTKGSKLRKNSWVEIDGDVSTKKKNVTSEEVYCSPAGQKWVIKSAHT